MTSLALFKKEDPPSEKGGLTIGRREVISTEGEGLNQATALREFRKIGTIEDLLITIPHLAVMITRIPFDVLAARGTEDGYNGTKPIVHTEKQAHH